MKVYKYRGGDDRIFERDLESLCKNYFWASTFESLNDPYENTVLYNQLDDELKLISTLFGQTDKISIGSVLSSLNNLLAKNTNLGVYSLSKTFKSELLWAYYANSHKGFCIEYDLNTLLDKYKSYEFYPFDVEYSKSPPNINTRDCSDQLSIMKKISGTKSLHWRHEEEYRIVTDGIGSQPHNYKAIKAIYFGLRMPDEHKKHMMYVLRGRGLKYFQIERIENSYELVAKPVEDINGSEITYLCKLKMPMDISYDIISHNHDRFKDKATIEIELETKITKESLIQIAETIQTYLFWYSKQIFMFYKVKNLDTQGMNWATTHYREGKIGVWINEYVVS